METRNLRKTRQGVVISNKMDKTIVIAAKRGQHRRYRSYYGDASLVEDKALEIS